LADFVAGGLPT